MVVLETMPNVLLRVFEPRLSNRLPQAKGHFPAVQTLINRPAQGRRALGAVGSPAERQCSRPDILNAVTVKI